MFHRFQVQLIIWFVLILLLTSCMISVLYFQATSAGQRERQESLLIQQAGEYAGLLESRVQSVQSDALSIISNAIFQEYLTYPYQKPAYRIKAALYSFQPMVRWLLSTNTQYDRIHFLTTSSYTAGDPYVDQLTDYAGELWVEETLQAGAAGFWQNAHPPQPFRYAAAKSSLTASYSLNFLASSTGLVLIDVGIDWLYEGIPFVISVETGEVIYSQEYPEIVGSVLTMNGTGAIQTATVAGTDYYLYTRRSESLGIDLAACIEASYIQQALAQSNRYFILMVAACLCVTLTLVLIFSNSVVQRMKIIHRNITKVTQGDYEVAYAATREDEIDELGLDVVSMGRQMNQMVNQKLNQQMLLREAEFRALQQQINPHFIFNMLQTVQMMAEINGQSELADIIGQFGRMVRYNLYAEMNVPLQEELQNVTDYLVLQKLMMNDELNAHFDIEEAAIDIEVPRLILQPLVENAVLHGKIKGKILNVSVRVRSVHQGLQVCIENDGRLLSAERENTLRATLREVILHPGSIDGANAQDNLALINIQKRLNIRFGADCALSIRNILRGVRVDFTIPGREGIR